MEKVGAGSKWEVWGQLVSPVIIFSDVVPLLNPQENDFGGIHITSYNAVHKKIGQQIL